MKITKRPTVNVKTKRTITYIQKLRRINPMSLIDPWSDSSWRSDNPTSNLEVPSYQQRKLNFNGWIIYPCEVSYWKPENKNKNLEGNSYQKRNLNFNAWMKWTQQPTRKFQTKLTVSYIQILWGNTSMSLHHPWNYNYLTPYNTTRK